MRKKKEEKNNLKQPESFWLYSADLSQKRPGFCKLHISTNNQSADINNISFSSVDNKTKKKTHGMLLYEINSEMKKFFAKQNEPIFFVREKAFVGRGSQYEMGIYKVVGIADLLLYNMSQESDYCYEWDEIYPVTVKKEVTGNGKATKEEVACAQKKYIGEQEYAFDDESDAAAVAVAWLIKNKVQNFIDIKETIDYGLECSKDK